MTSSQPRQCRRIISRPVLCSRRSERLPSKSREHRASQHSAGSYRNSVQKIAPRDVAIHSKFSVVAFAHLGLLVFFLDADSDSNKTGFCLQNTSCTALFFRRAGIMQKHDFPLTTSFEHDI